jgi:small GTP-binding protein
MSGSSSTTQSFKVLLIGDNRVGKTAFVTCVSTGKYDAKYIPTTHPHVTNLKFDTNDGQINIDILDDSGNKRYGKYYNDVHAAILMFDMTSIASFNNICIWYQSLLDQFPGGRDGKCNIPVIVCGNKSDCIDGMLSWNEYHNLILSCGNACVWYEISSKSKSKCMIPLHALIKTLVRNHKLSFREDFSGLPTACKSLCSLSTVMTITEPSDDDKNVIVADEYDSLCAIIQEYFKAHSTVASLDMIVKLKAHISDINATISESSVHVSDSQVNIQLID